MQDDTIQVCYALHDREGARMRHMGASIASLLANTERKVRVHLIHDALLSPEDREKFRELVEEKHGQALVLHSMEGAELPERYGELLADRAAPGKYPMEAAYLLFAMELLQDEPKVILLDADMLFHLDIRFLWEEDAGRHGIAAVPETANPGAAGYIQRRQIVASGEVRAEDFLETGVLLAEPAKLLRENRNLIGRMLRRAGKSEAPTYLQDSVNRFLARKARKLPLKYNVLVTCQRAAGNPNAAAGSGVFRFTADNLREDAKDSYEQLFWAAYQATPWHEEGKNERIAFLGELLHENDYRSAAGMRELRAPEELESLAATGDVQKVAPELFGRLILQFNVQNQLLLRLFRESERYGQEIGELLALLPAPMARIWRRWQGGGEKLQPDDRSNYSTMLLNTFLTRGSREELRRFVALAGEIGQDAVKETADALAAHCSWELARKLYDSLPRELLQRAEDLHAYGICAGRSGHPEQAGKLFEEAVGKGYRASEPYLVCIRECLAKKKEDA